MERVAYLGPEGSYSHLAAKKFRPQAEACAYASFAQTVQAVAAGECSLAAVPIENSVNGAVNQNLDLLQAAQGIFAFEECDVRIEHRLALLKGADKGNIKRIFSHSQALEQCAGFLNKNYPAAELIAAASTSASLKLLKSPTDACIVGAHTRAAGIELLPGNIADEDSNVTHFLLLKRGAPDPRVSCRKIYFSATCLHVPGALLRLLEPLQAGGVNLTKIESRPIKERPGEYRFFIEIEGDYASEPVRRVLDGVGKQSLSLRVLGTY